MWIGVGEIDHPLLFNEEALLSGLFEQSRAHHEPPDRRKPFTGLEVGKHERPLPAHAARVTVHDLQRGPYMRREVDFIDQGGPSA